MSNTRKAPGVPNAPAPNQGTPFDQLLACLDVLADNIALVTPTELAVFDEEEEAFFTACWQTLELALEVVDEYAQAIQIISALSEEAKQAADGAERTAAGLIVPKGAAR